MRLRIARVADAGAVARVHHTTWVTAYGELLPAEFWETHTLAERTRGWQRSLMRGLAPTLAEVDGKAVGFAHASRARAQHRVEPVRETQLWMLYVLDDHHGTGVGQALLDAVVPPGTPCQLWVAEDNPRARRFYERNGFTVEGARITDDSFANITELRMVR
ncbi:GNAT family N-acetyltransferase [Myceligenerans pegani]|uniref:GNAT family N-acetyltransferase n=1 Tax=Myceligenerans pegani TaxID=2776917 RepID=UPI00299D2952|nr:GNAT family N-acetyltransferase [Myceligenerans sp. TRM 65318]